jgi:hypothetical protein
MAKRKEHKQGVEAEIDDVLLHMASHDEIDLSFKDSGEMVASLTAKGENEALGIIGGHDVAELAQALTRWLKEEGDFMGGKVTTKEGIHVWSQMVTISRILLYMNLPLLEIASVVNKTLDDNKKGA